MRADVAMGVRERSDIQLASLVVGAVFLLVGILGFIPGITTNYDAMAFAGSGSEAELLGLFQVSILHNIVHLLFGVVGIWAARDIGTSRTFLIGGGIVYFAIGVYGLIFPGDESANFVPMNMADVWLHFVLSIGMIGLGLLLGRRLARPTTTPTTTP